MNEADKLIIKQLLDYCHAVEQRIADYGVVDPLWAWNTIQFDIPKLQEILEKELSA